MKNLTKNKPVFIALIVISYLAVLLIGMSMASTPETKTVTKTVTKQVTIEKTPQVCLDLIETDNQVFTKVGEYMGSLQFGQMADYLNSKVGIRTAQALECMSKK